MGCSLLRELETKAKNLAVREMFPNGGGSPLQELETKVKAEAFREMFPNGMKPFTGVRKPRRRL